MSKLISVVILLLFLGAATILAPLAHAETAVPGDTVTAVPFQEDDAGAQPDSETESSLPESLSRIFASLGLYVVTMFTMAIGTEIVVDVFKLIAGFKSKPTAAKTLAEYERMLPGTLESLGVGAEARQNLKEQLASLKELLQPVFKAEQLIVNLRAADFSAALEEATGTADPSDVPITQAAAVIKEQLHQALDQVKSDSVLGQAATTAVRQQIDQAVDDLAQRAVDITPEELYQQSMVLVNGELATAVTSWAEVQMKTLQDVSHETAHLLYESQVRPLLQNSGLSAETEERLRRQFEDLLQNIKISKHTDVLLTSLNDLLLEVERQRNELASFWRKLFWRITDGLQERFSWLSWLPDRREDKLDPVVRDPGTVASKLLEIERRDKKENASRIYQLRLTAVLVGVILAYLLQVDSADLLGDLMSQDANFLAVTLVPQQTAFFAWIERVFGIPTYDLTAGVVLTGLAASAGSSFWHDQLSRLQSVKQGAEAAYAALQPVIVNKQAD